MSLFRRGSGWSAVLGFAFVLAISATADDKPPTCVVADRKGASTRVESPGADDADRVPESRVVVRDLRGRDEPPVPFDDARCYGGSHWRQRGYPPGVLFDWPYGFAYRYEPYPAGRRLIDAYRAWRYIEQKERERRFNRRDMAERKERLLDQHERAVRAGLQCLRESQHAQAIVAFTLAAKLNHGDPACRIHLAQARLAQGHYVEAGLALRRALELQPKLVYADLHLQEYYESPDALAGYTDALVEWVKDNPARPEVYFLLGFLEFQRGDFQAAHTAFGHVAGALPNDNLTQAYLEISKPARD